MSDKKAKPFIGMDHGTNQIILASGGLQVTEMRPVQIHHRSNGSLTDGPTFAIVMINDSHAVYGQISLEMMNDALEDIGYIITPIIPNP